MEIGDRLKELRLAKKLTQKELGHIVNLSHNTIGGYETGINEPSLEMLKFFSSFYNVSVDYILGLTSIKTPVNQLVEGITSQNGYIDYETFLNQVAQIDTDNQIILTEIVKALILKSNDDRKTKL